MLGTEVVKEDSEAAREEHSKDLDSLVLDGLSPYTCVVNVKLALCSRVISLCWAK